MTDIYDQHKAANLISTAPDLLEHLERVVNCIDYGYDLRRTGILEGCRSIIAKAKGAA